MKIKMKMKKMPHRHEINSPKARHEHKYSKCKKCLSMMMLICIKKPKQHLKLKPRKS